MAENKKFTRLINSDGTKQAVALDMVSFDEQTKKLTLYSSVDNTIKEETIIPASEVDATLSQSGLAADAKATGDAVKDVVKVGGTASGFTGIIVGTGEEEIELVEQKDFDAEIAKLNAKVGTPLVANAASAMVDTTKIYVYTGNENGYVNGNWYFYNGTNWESGGVYNAVAVQTDKTLTQENMAADAKKTGDEISQLKSDLDENVNDLKSAIGNNEYTVQESLDTSEQTWTEGKYISKTSGAPVALDGYSYTDVILDSNVTKVAGYTNAAPNSNIGVAFVKADGTFISGEASTNTGKYDYNYEINVPNEAAKFRVSCRTNYTELFTCTFTKIKDGLEKRVNENDILIRQNAESIVDVDNELTALKNGLIEDATLNIWEVGRISAADGNNYSSTIRLRTTKKVTNKDCLSVHTLTGYVFAVYAYDVSTGTYVGALNTSGGFSKNNTNLALVSEYELTSLYAYKFEMRDSESPSSEIDVSDAVNFVFKEYNYYNAIKEGIDNRTSEYVEATKNLFEKEFIKGLISVGVFVSRTGAKYAATKEYTEVTPNTVYTVSWKPLSAYSDSSGSFSVYFYSGETESSFISSETEYHVVSLHKLTFTTPSTCQYVRFYMLNNNAQSWDTDTNPQEFQLELGSEASIYINHNKIQDDKIDIQALYNKLIENGFVEGEIIPDYYFTNNYLPSKVARINELSQASAGTGETVVFITDEHWAFNAQQSPKLLNYIFKRTHIKKLFSGGDLSNGIQDLTWDSAAHTFRDAWKGEIYRAVGNHEYLSESNTDSDIYYWFSADNSNQISDNPVRGYYYVDNVQQKIRYVVLNAFSAADGTTANVGYEQTQREWVQNTALNVDHGWTIVIITHVFYRSGPVYSDGQITNEDKVMESSLNANALAEILDAYNGNGKIAFIMQGHSHYDKITSTPGGIPVVLTTCDKTLPNEEHDAPRQNRVKGTISEQAFDVVVIDTQNETATFIRIGQQALDGIGTDPGDYVEERTISWGT